MPMNSREMVKLLREYGFVKKSQNSSSHLKMYNRQLNTTVIVPIHARGLGKGLEQAILAKAGISKTKNG